MAIPTTFSIQFKCGHSETKDLSSTPAGKRKARAFGLGKNFVCSRCFKASRRDELDKHDQEMFKWVDLFNPYDLYSKNHTPPDWKQLRPYYEDLVSKYLPSTLKF